jgi:hypothetical protein
MIQHITGIPRNQLFFLVYKTLFTGKSRSFIDAFVESIALQTLGFSVQTIKGKVARALILKFLKIYLYGYLNGLRSPRN